ncbi:hypothetical protein D3C79_652060 [compost metagenome]
MGVAADRRDQYRKAGDQCFKQHRAGIFVVGRMNQQVSTKQETRDITAALEELHLVGQAEGRALQLEYLWVILTDDHQPGTLAQCRRQGR